MLCYKYINIITEMRKLRHELKHHLKTIIIENGQLKPLTLNSNST